MVCGVSLVCLAACNLDLLPESTMTDAAFWKSESDLRNACNRFYQQMNGNNDLGTGFSHDYRSDELFGNSSNSISAGFWTVPSSNGSWTDAYWRIFIANNILEKAERTGLADEVINPYLAEACFFRAYYYFELVKKYGDVPLIMKAIDDTKAPELDTPRTPRSEVLAQCYEDLDFAAQWLPDIDSRDADGAGFGHVSRSAALAMLVRVGLYEGTYAKYHSLTGEDSKTHLKKAIDAAEAMIREGKHSLYPDFERLFTYDGEGRQNRENVFVKIYGPNGAGTTVHGNSRQLENTVNLTRNMVDMFLYQDGLPKGKSPLEIKQETRFNDVLQNRDPRLLMTVYQVGDKDYKNNDFTPFTESKKSFAIKKGFILEDWATNSKETLDKMVIRYAEVLISYAEALYEYNGSITDTQLDQTVNQLRRRVGMPVMLTNEFARTNGLDILEEIRRERTVEFIDENKRYDDIIRWKIAEKVLTGSLLGCRLSGYDVAESKVNDLKARITLNGGMFNGKKVCDQDSIYVLDAAEDRRFNTAKDYLYPVPLEEIARSHDNVVQNPGWE